MMKVQRPSKSPRILRGVQANAGIEANYRRKLDNLIAEMHRSVVYQINATYRANEPEVVALAQDESPAMALRNAIKKLSSKWLKRFDDGAPRLAKWFSLSVQNRSDAALKKILKDAGFAIEWKASASQNDALQAAIGENVALIRSIPSQYFTQIEGMVMRSVQTGRDLKTLTDDLEKNFGVTRRRAVIIARDQTSKATSVFNRVRQMEAFGNDVEAVWRHSGGGKTPRPSHVKAGREQVRFKVAEGWADPDLGGKRIWPGTEINCRCFSRVIMEGIT